MVLYMCFDRFLLDVESRDLSQADNSIIRVSSFPSWAGHALGIWICGCSLFYKRELWASKSAGAHSTKSRKISGCKRWCPRDLQVCAPAAPVLTHALSSYAALIVSIFLLVVRVATDHISYRKFYLICFLQNFLYGNMEIIIFDLRGYRGCWRPKILLRG